MGFLISYIGVDALARRLFCGGRRRAIPGGPDEARWLPYCLSQRRFWRPGRAPSVMHVRAAEPGNELEHVGLAVRAGLLMSQSHVGGAQMPVRSKRAASGIV